MKVRYSRLSCSPGVQKPTISKANIRTEGNPKKIDIVPFNQRISTAAKDKNLSHALEQWESIETNRLKPTAYTYCAMVNAFVRCGQLSRAEEFVKKMEGAIPLSGATRDGFMITYTALLKGYFMSSAFDRSHVLFGKVLSMSPVGSRTLDTYLRGCLRTGAFEEGLAAYGDSKTEKSDASKIYASKMMAIRLAVKSASDIGSTEDPSVCVHIGCAYVRLGKQERAVEWFTRGKELLFSTTPERQFDKLQKSEMVRLCDFFTDKSLHRQSSAGDCRLARYIGRFIAISGDRKEQVKLWKSLGLGKYKSDSEMDEMAADAKRNLEEALVLHKQEAVIVELCSGSGEWIAREAWNNAAKMYIASEFRFDRCVDILTRMCFQQLENVWILCGDARAIPAVIALGSVEELHVNYPEPPPINNCHIEEDMSSDIVTKSFLKNIRPLLNQEKGILKIVSDDKLYMQSVANVVNDAWGSNVFPKSGKTLVDSYFARFFSKKAKRWSLDVKVADSLLVR